MRIGFFIRVKIVGVVDVNRGIIIKNLMRFLKAFVV